MRKQEERLQVAVCTYLKLQYPHVIFMSDIASGMKLSIGSAVRAKKMRSSRGQPDLFVCEPRGIYHGLFLELKREGTKVFLKDGVTIPLNEHLIEQHQMLSELRTKGYMAEFACGFLEAKKIIDEYLINSR